MRRIAWLVIPAALLALLAYAMFASRGPGAATAFTLKAGDCFDIPGDAQIGDIPTVDCATPHDAQVFVAVAMTGDTPSGPVQYPSTATMGEWVATHCGPDAVRAFAGLTASASLAVGYFYPDENAWNRGERQLTCYLHGRDGAKLPAPLQGGSASVAPS